MKDDAVRMLKLGMVLLMFTAMGLMACGSSSNPQKDATVPDTKLPDTRVVDTRQPDTKVVDTGQDLGQPDTGQDLGQPDQGSDAGTVFDPHKTLPLSLHGTTNGQNHWYTQGGAPVTGIPYDSLACKNCHIDVKNKGCSQCHDTDANGNPVEGDKENDPKTCYVCHGREAAMAKIQQAKGDQDVHFKAGKKCADCHTREEIHGDGKVHQTYLEPGFFQVSCRGCHTGDNPKGPKMKTSIPEHAMHGGADSNIACQACHVKRELSCYNCHFNAMVDYKKKAPVGALTDFVYLMNVNGKVTTGTFMDFVYLDKNNKTHVVEVNGPDMRHTITKDGRHCGDCHDNAAMQAYKKDGKIHAITWDDTKKKMVVNYPVIPYIKGAIVRDHVIPADPHAAPACQGELCSYKDWVKVPADASITVHDIGKPLTQEQVDALKQSH